MINSQLVERLAALSKLAGIPREELEWIAAHGNLDVYEAGTVIAPKGKPIDKLWIILSGHVAVQVDRGAGPRRVTEWRDGEVSGMLPYSRMTGPPGDNYLEAKSELLSIQKDFFPEMTNRCPAFTAHTVHSMLDRARRFNASDLQDEKMISLGKLAAGLAHEINNPASATVRSAKHLLASLAEADIASRSLGAAGLTDELIDSIGQIRLSCLAQPIGDVLSPIQQADREDDIAEWLNGHQVDRVYAESLAATTITIDTLDKLAHLTSVDELPVAVRWLAAGCATHSLAVEIEQAATRISELVAAVKRFTYMDNLAAPELVNVETGLRDTVRVLAAKTKSKSATIGLDIEANLPHVYANGSELNQVWLNLIDNALDAIPESGRINISAHKKLDKVLVLLSDNGPGIPSEVMPRIFDPFFTTKPPGQGTGLGLEITRRLVRRYQGDISVESLPGQTIFQISLRVEKPKPTK